METYFEELKIRLIRDARRTNDMAKEKDINRNRTNYGSCIAWAVVLQDMGHEVRVPAWESDGFLKIDRIRIDGETTELIN